MRITQLQYERLLMARHSYGLTVQEHVRRAIDAYLNRLEKAKAANVQAPSPELPEPVTPPVAVPVPEPYERTPQRSAARIGRR